MIRVLENDNKIFTKSTGMPYYNSFYNEDELEEYQLFKNTTYEIVEMTPTKYFEECADLKHTTVDVLKREREKHIDKIEQYMSDMGNGDKFPMPVIDYMRNQQEGLHRMYAVGELYGWDYKVPVMVVKKYK